MITGGVLRTQCVQFLFAILISFAAVFFIAPALANAATLSLSPGTGVYSVGATFNVQVLVNTQGQSINAAEGTLSFNSSELSVVAINRGGSIFSLWTREPEFSNSAGTISFGGGSPSGYTGGAGNIMTVTFRANRDTTANVTFSSGVVLAADGRGTNVISAMNNGAYTFNAQEINPEPEYIAPANTPGAPQVTSETHPDPDKWYNAPTATLAWTVPGDVSSVRLLLDENSGSIPTRVYEEVLTERTIEDIEDGIWYFHAQFRNEEGWGKVAHYRVAVDTQKPTFFEIKEPEEEDSANPERQFIFDAQDETSGIAYFEVQIDDGEKEQWFDEAGDGRYSVPALLPGKHTLIVEAFDHAGNSLTESVTFEVEALDPPVFTEYPEELNSTVIPVFKGTAIPGGKVTIFMQRDRNEYARFDVLSDENGQFTFIPDARLEDGAYTIWAEVVDVRGAKSEASEKITFAVQPPGFIRIGAIALSVMSIVIPLVSLLFFLGFLIWYGWFRFMLLRKRLLKEIDEAEESVVTAFEELAEDIKTHVEKMEKAKKRRKLTRNEASLVKMLKDHLKKAEKTILKEVEDIEEELEIKIK